MRGSVESPFEAQLHETVVIGLNTGVHEQYKKIYILGSKPHASGIFFVAHKLAETK